MAGVKFGVDQINCPTPPIAKKIYRGLMGAIAIWAVISPNFPEIPAHAINIVNRLCMVGLPVFYGLCQMLGWSKPE